MAPYQTTVAKANNVSKFSAHRQPKPDDVWLGFYPFGFAEDDAREYASGQRIPDNENLAAACSRHDWDGLATSDMWCRICTALPDEIAKCGVRLARGDVPVRVAYRAPAELEPSGDFHVGIFVIGNPDADELDELTLESPNSFLAPLGLYWDHAGRPEPIRGLKRCFRLTPGGWEDRGPTHQRAPRSSGFTPSADCVEFEMAFETAASGEDAATSAVRDAFIARRPGTPAAKRGAWFRELNKARAAGFVVTDCLISRGVRRSANASERER